MQALRVIRSVGGSGQARGISRSARALAEVHINTDAAGKQKVCEL